MKNHTRACMHTRTHARTHTYAHTHTCACTHAHTHTRARTHAHNRLTVMFVLMAAWHASHERCSSARACPESYTLPCTWPPAATEDRPPRCPPGPRCEDLLSRPPPRSWRRLQPTHNGLPVSDTDFCVFLSDKAVLRFDTDFYQIYGNIIFTHKTSQNYSA